VCSVRTTEEDAMPEPETEPVTEPATEPVTGLLSVLEGLDHEPLEVQAERLEAVRRGLDAALARSDADGLDPARLPAAGHG
jgi:hypothetical protein